MRLSPAAGGSSSGEEVLIAFMPAREIEPAVHMTARMIGSIQGIEPPPAVYGATSESRDLRGSAAARRRARTRLSTFTCRIRWESSPQLPQKAHGARRGSGSNTGRFFYFFLIESLHLGL